MEKSRSRHHFQKEDDEKLVHLVNTIGKDWKAIHLQLPTWTERQLRDRYTNYLQPHINNSNWTPYEDSMLLTKVHEIGHKWAKLSTLFPNRSPVHLKNRYSFLTGSGARQMRVMRDKNKTRNSLPPKVSINDDIDTRVINAVDTNTVDIHPIDISAVLHANDIHGDDIHADDLHADDLHSNDLNDNNKSNKNIISDLPDEETIMIYHNEEHYHTINHRSKDSLHFGVDDGNKK